MENSDGVLVLLPRELREVVGRALAQLVQALEVVLRVLDACVETRRAVASVGRARCFPSMMKVGGLFCGFDFF